NLPTKKLGLQRRAFDYMEGLVNRIMNAPIEGLADKDLVSAVSILMVFRFSAFLPLSRAEITYGVLVLGCLVYAVFYVRLALLFAFIYLALAKVQHIPWTFLDSMVDSLAMPLSYTF